MQCLAATGYPWRRTMAQRTGQALSARAAPRVAVRAVLDKCQGYLEFRRLLAGVARQARLVRAAWSNCQVYLQGCQ
ncbi:hypothetical protein BST37_21715 [Mycobacterium noviomagense]|uniref:Transposase n=1 Tax=Mycobacterium noviomagense TaxID=459858 RepID=A0ABX3T0M1_9MYCO|nr:hypothetical protein BST37_21715 [Mycobacterium noviomagense]